MMLTQRDQILFDQLTTFALMTTKQIQKNVFCNIALTTVLRRLRVLEDEGYIQRIEGLANSELAWCVQLKACAATSDRVPKRHFNRANLAHDVKLTDLRIALEGRGLAHSWIPEHEIRSKMARSHGLNQMLGRNVPDGLMGIEYDGLKQSVAIELELNFKNQGRYKSIFDSYRHKQSLWGIWYLAANKSIGNNVDRIWRKRFGESRQPFLMWSRVDEVIHDPINATIHCYDKILVAGEVWKIKGAVPPAQVGALGVSSVSSEKIENRNELSIENEKELPTKAS